LYEGIRNLHDTRRLCAQSLCEGTPLLGELSSGTLPLRVVSQKSALRGRRLQPSDKRPCVDQRIPLRSRLDLGRFVLLDEVPGNGETFFLGRCFDLLRREGLAGVVSFCDPLPRHTEVGETFHRGRIGTYLPGVYADDLFNILFRLDPTKMIREGFEHGEAGLRRFCQT